MGVRFKGKSERLWVFAKKDNERTKKKRKEKKKKKTILMP